MASFVPQHLSATRIDLEGNAGRGRIVLLPGSPGRAERVAQELEAVTVRRHPRGHHVYLGTHSRIEPSSATRGPVDIAVVPTGMGCPSTEIIVTELLHLGARQLLRIGTCGAIQPWVNIGDFIIANAAVRDESTTKDLLPAEFPALASSNWVRSLEAAASESGVGARTHTGVVHTKASLYAREFAEGPLADEHRRYKLLLERARVLGSEMEAALLFVLASLSQDGSSVSRTHPVEAGAVLVVVGDVDHGFAPKEAIEQAETDLILLALVAARHQAQALILA